MSDQKAFQWATTNHNAGNTKPADKSTPNNAVYAGQPKKLSPAEEWAAKKGKPIAAPPTGNPEWATTHHSDNKPAEPIKGAWNANYQ